MSEPMVTTGFQEHRDQYCHRCTRTFSAEVGYRVQWATIRAHMDWHARTERRLRIVAEEDDRIGLPSGLVRTFWGSFSPITRAELDAMDAAL